MSVQRRHLVLLDGILNRLDGGWVGVDGEYRLCQAQIWVFGELRI